jgi:hypothetical protein
VNIDYKDIKGVKSEDAEALKYAQRLATALYEKHWKDSAPAWKVLPDLLGVLTQIDNMTAGLIRG